MFRGPRWLASRTHILNWSPRQTFAVPLAIAIAAVLLGGYALRAPTAFAYSCGVGSSLKYHCYALARTKLPVDPTFGPSQGAETNIVAEPLTCGSSCGGFVDNEMWVADASFRDWVETGYISNSSGTDHYFWADLRPRDCSSCLNFHDLGSMPSGDIGQNAHFLIQRWSSGTNGTYYVEISTPNVYTYAWSTSNSMSVDHVDMGQELAGSGGAHAPSARYSYRYYFDSGGNIIGIYGNYSYFENAPPYLYGIAGSTDYYTQCC